MTCRGVALVLACGVSMLPGCGGGDKEGSSFNQQVADAKGISNAKVRARELTKIGLQLHGNKDAAGAETAFIAAREACGEISDAIDQAEELAVLAQAYARTGQKSAAGGIIAEAERIVSGATPSSPLKYQTKATVWNYLGRAQQAVGNTDAAVSAVKRAAAVAEELTPAAVPDAVQLGRGKAEILSSAAGTFFTVGDKPQGEQTLGQALQAARAIAETKTQAAVLAGIAAVQHKQDAAAAVPLFEEAATAARAVSDEYERVFALAEVAVAMRKAGLGDQAGKLLNDAEAIADKMQKLDLRKQAQDRVREARG